MKRPNVIIRPVEVNVQNEPLDPALWAQYAAFCGREFGSPIIPSKSLKTWAAVIMRDDGGYDECIGVLVLQYQITCPTFHIKKPVAREDIPAIHEARDGLIGRAKAFVQDNGGSGSIIHVYCAPEAEEYWKKFLDSLKAKPSGMWSIVV